MASGQSGTGSGIIGYEVRRAGMTPVPWPPTPQLIRLPPEAHVNVAYWQRLCCTGTLVILLLPACSLGNRPAPMPPELTEAGVQARFRIAADSDANPVNTVGRPGIAASRPKFPPRSPISNPPLRLSRWPRLSLLPNNTAPGCSRPGPPSNGPAVNSRPRLALSCLRSPSGSQNGTTTL